MKRLLFAIVALLGLTGAVLADPVEGVWKTQVDDGAYAYVTFAPCGERLCGVISRTFNSDGEYQSENLGKKLVWDMVALGGGKYGSGKIWQPSKDRVFSSKMQLSGDTLYVRGCVAAVICKKQTWTRVQ
jgi:uncharacterized protein (DUF2147 family)